MISDSLVCINNVVFPDSSIERSRRPSQNCLNANIEVLIVNLKTMDKSVLEGMSGEYFVYHKTVGLFRCTRMSWSIDQIENEQCEYNLLFGIIEEIKGNKKTQKGVMVQDLAISMMHDAFHVEDVRVGVAHHKDNWIISTVMDYGQHTGSIKMPMGNLCAVKVAAEICRITKESIDFKTEIEMEMED